MIVTCHLKPLQYVILIETPSLIIYHVLYRSFSVCAFKAEIYKVFSSVLVYPTNLKLKIENNSSIFRYPQI